MSTTTRKRNNLQIIQAFVIIVLVLWNGYLIFKDTLENTGISIQQLTDSLAAHDNIRDAQLIELKTQYTQDSIEIINLRNKIDNIPVQIKEVNSKYNDKRNLINTLPIDSQLQFFSDWLSKETSNR